MTRTALLVSALATAFAAGCGEGGEAGPTAPGTARGETRATPSPASFPSSPPAAAKCSGTVLDHRDVRHPSLGTVRVFLVRRSTYQPAFGCVAVVTGSGRTLATTDVDIYEKSLKFADPVTDSTKNIFVTYNPGRYDGVLVLVPKADGFEDVEWSDPSIHYRGGRFAFYHAELVGPGADGRYAIVASSNSCNPSCADGVTSKTTLHWNGHDYLPVE